MLTSATLASLVLLALHFFSTNGCSPDDFAASSSCPPFSSGYLPYPFSLTPGCGHPGFQITCSSTPQYSTMVINNLTFALRRYQLNNSTLRISPLPNPNQGRGCSSDKFHFLPSQPINLPHSPFRFSNSSSSQISVRSRPSTPGNCSLCPWLCELKESPDRLLHDCSVPAIEMDCHCDDILLYLDQLLLKGIEIEWDSSDGYFDNCTACRSNNGVCGYNSTDPQHPFVCYTVRSNHNRHRLGRDAKISIGIASLVFLVLVVASVVLLRRLRRPKPVTDEEDQISLFLRLSLPAVLLPPVFTYDELVAATNSFDENQMIGGGGFGSVYRGNLNDGRLVAVKRLDPTALGGEGFAVRSFCNEIVLLSSLDHIHIVNLRGYCSYDRGLFLVYGYVPNGTLAQHIGAGSLTWQARVDKALQVATAMEHLHFSVVPPIIHRDITTTNILVGEDLTVKLGDFGLSRQLVLPEISTSAASTSAGVVLTDPQGTPGYIDPDYMRSSRLTQKSDVYSFGVVLFELITGMRAVDERGAILADFMIAKMQTGSLIEVVDPVVVALGGQEVLYSVVVAAELAFKCVEAEKDDRPDAREVVAELTWIRSRV